MTDAEHADLSRRLALAIGWHRDDVTSMYGKTAVRVRWKTVRFSGYDWRTFNYRDPLVIWPIAERYDCFPWLNNGTHWCASKNIRVHHGDTPAEAVARAVVGAHDD